MSKPADLPRANPSRKDAFRYLIGLDVGSTTVKGVALEAASGRLMWSDYRRHEMQPAQRLLEVLNRMEAEVGIQRGNCALFITGSGGSGLAKLIGARFVQEVNAVAIAVEMLHPGAGSVIELGGQDAKIILFKGKEADGDRQKFFSMNDKCAGGTGVIIDKINAKLNIPADELCGLPYAGVRLHPVAGKCGVFAETDINDLQKQGVPKEELMASLYDALVLQTLTVLLRGQTLRPQVLLLGGPNTFLRGLREAWQKNILLMWKQRGVELPAGLSAEELIHAPANALYFAAMGAALSAETGEGQREEYRGTSELAALVGSGGEVGAFASPGLISSDDELAELRAHYAPAAWVPRRFCAGETVRAFIGLDGGSTSTKAVLLSEGGEVLRKAYQLSKGNPIEDAIQVLTALREQAAADAAELEILGVGTTGYSKDVLQRVFHADVALVETVAHTESAMHYHADPHVIVDVGGQDIKLIILAKGRVKEFKLNTQCSAGNGYFLQSTAEGLGIAVSDYAGAAFAARRMPVFGYGCAVFLQSDIVNFQRQGWSAPEILAGLAAVLPKNVFLHVAKIPDLTSLGSRFVLQGGTHNNLAVVKAMADFLQAAFRSCGRQPEILVHPHCGEAGAIGAALEAQRLWRGEPSRFIGLDAAARIRYTRSHGEETRCNFCKNTCVRTFLDVAIGSGEVASAYERIVLANCDKGSAEDITSMREIRSQQQATRSANPDLVAWSAREVWRSRAPEVVADVVLHRKRRSRIKPRGELRVAMPRVLSFYTYAPLFSAYLESLGVRAENIVYSSFTSSEMYRAGSSRGAIDPCFPSKVAIAHMHDLLFNQHVQRPLDVIFFPMLDMLASPLPGSRGNNACPTTSITPETVEAAYTRESDLFAERGIRYVHPLLNLADRRLFARQMFEAWSPLLGLTAEENEHAVAVGFRELEGFNGEVSSRARRVLNQLEAERRLGIVMLGRAYHHDPGINHGILKQLQNRGYPIFSQSALPHDAELLERLFGAEVRAGLISHPMDVSDVWKTSFSASSNLKLWAAKFTARHPNLVAVELSNFKCGHDAPIYGVIERIIECSGTPYFSFKDLDENRPTSTIKLRVETIDYFLKRYREQMLPRWERQAAVVPLA